MPASPNTPDFGLRVQPMQHVANLSDSITFYEAIGATLLFGSRDGDWALLRFGETTLSLLAHAPSAENPEPVELQFTTAAALDTIEDHLRRHAPDMIARGVSDEAFGRMLKLRTPDGLVVKLLELERDLIS